MSGQALAFCVAFGIGGYHERRSDKYAERGGGADGRNRCTWPFGRRRPAHTSTLDAQVDSDRLEAAVAAATRHNEELDRRLSGTGIVDVALFGEFAAVQDDPNASSVGWLQAKLRVLAERVSSGASLGLHEPSLGAAVIMQTPEELSAWAERHFPIARFRP